jgi:hypothetical protein
MNEEIRRLLSVEICCPHVIRTHHREDEEAELANEGDAGKQDYAAVVCENSPSTHSHQASANRHRL